MTPDPGGGATVVSVGARERLTYDRVMRDGARALHIGASFKARFGPSGRRLVTRRKRITLWDIEAGKRIATGPPLRHAASVDVWPDGRLVVAKNTIGAFYSDVISGTGERLDWHP